MELGEESWKYLTLQGLGDSYARYYMAICLLKLGRYKEGSELMKQAAVSGAPLEKIAGLFSVTS
ncbi:hypothetical protein D3C75_1356490 [compost metagenome]